MSLRQAETKGRKHVNENAVSLSLVFVLQLSSNVSLTYEHLCGSSILRR